MSNFPDSPIGGPPPGDAVFDGLDANSAVFTDAAKKLSTKTNAQAFDQIKQNALAAYAGVTAYATDLEHVTGTEALKAATPAGLTARLAAPGPIGGTTPDDINATTLNSSDLTASRGVVTDVSKNLVSDDAATGTGAPVRAVEPAMTAPTMTPAMSQGAAIINSGFAGTVSSATNVVTFTEADDAIDAGYRATNPIPGYTIIAATQTRIITGWNSSTECTVDSDPDPAWAAATAITSVQGPMHVVKTSAGVLAGYFTADGTLYLAGDLSLPGYMEALAGSGAVVIWDQAVGDLALDAEISGSIRLGATTVLKIYGQADGAGGVKNLRIDILGAMTVKSESITATSEGVAASLATVTTSITTNGDSDLDNVTLANGILDQVKIFAVKAVGDAADSVKITPATMVGGTQITFGASPLGLGCQMVYTSTGWLVTGNNGGVIA